MRGESARVCGGLLLPLGLVLVWDLRLRRWSLMVMQRRRQRRTVAMVRWRLGGLIERCGRCRARGEWGLVGLVGALTLRRLLRCRLFLEVFLLLSRPWRVTSLLRLGRCGWVTTKTRCPLRHIATRPLGGRHVGSEARCIRWRSPVKARVRRSRL